MEKATVDPARLMKLVAKSARRGAQFTPQGILKYPLTATEPMALMTEARALLDNIELEPVPA
jgi:transcription-repair coupling factor (superfamily II helicase)